MGAEDSERSDQVSSSASLDVLSPDGSLVATEPAHSPSRAGSCEVDSLTGPDDYWLTLTDAARVTRRQEVTIRRWVAAGSLPVRSRALGLNKRTRHVRASDVSRLTPIIDPSATISGATAQIDLLGIPVQQEHILAQQEETLQSLGALATRITEVTEAQQTQLEKQGSELARVGHFIEQVQTRFSARLEESEKQQTALARQLAQVQQELLHAAAYTNQLQDEVASMGAGLASYAGHQAEQGATQLQHQARIERLEPLADRILKIEERQSKEAQDRVEQQRHSDDVAAGLKALEQRMSEVEGMIAKEISQQRDAQQAADQQIKGLLVSLARLSKETRQQRSQGVKQASDLQQQVHDLGDDVRATAAGLQELAGYIEGQRQQLESLNGQILALSTTVSGLSQPTIEARQEVRPPRRRRPRQLKSDE